MPKTKSKSKPKFKTIYKTKSKNRKNKKTHKRNNKHRRTYKRKHRGDNTLYDKYKCAPKRPGEINDYTCYTNDSLIDLKKLWNSQNPMNKITEVSPKKIHRKLSILLKNMCNNEICWIKQLEKNNHTGSINLSTTPLYSLYLSDNFKPQYPNKWHSNPNEWLSNLDIDKVMSQYENAYDCFEFIGPTPIDFDSRDTNKIDNTCVCTKMCTFNLKSYLDAKKSKIGIIFNTDPHCKTGEHWISLFINIKKCEIFFYDSVGNKMPKEVNHFIKRICKQGKELPQPIHFKIDSNENIEHQRGDTECGMYSLFFIIHMLTDKLTPSYIKTHVFTDNYIQTFRKKLFNYYTE
jgi:hypothetical protein